MSNHNKRTCTHPPSDSNPLKKRKISNKSAQRLTLSSDNNTEHNCNDSMTNKQWPKLIDIRAQLTILKQHIDDILTLQSQLKYDICNPIKLKAIHNDLNFETIDEYKPQIFAYL
eukprot:733298_1